MCSEAGQLKKLQIYIKYISVKFKTNVFAKCLKYFLTPSRPSNIWSHRPKFERALRGALEFLSSSELKNV